MSPSSSVSIDHGREQKFARAASILSNYQVLIRHANSSHNVSRQISANMLCLFLTLRSSSQYRRRDTTSRRWLRAIGPSLSSGTGTGTQSDGLSQRTDGDDIPELLPAPLYRALRNDCEQCKASQRCQDGQWFRLFCLRIVTSDEAQGLDRESYIRSEAVVPSPNNFGCERP